MKVGLLAYGLDRPLTGIGRYTVELAKGLARMADGPELTLLRAGAAGPLRGEGFSSAALPGCRLLPGLMTLGNFFIPRIADRLDLDVVHDPVGVAPFLFGAGRAKTVVTLHDVFSWSHPGTSTLLEDLICRHWLPRTLPAVEAVITASGQSRADILRFLPADPARLTVLPYGIAACFHPLPAPQVKERLRNHFGLLSPYILYAGTAGPRKNIERLVKAFACLAEEYPQCRLVLAGPRNPKQKKLVGGWIREGLSRRILVTGSVSDSDLAVLYNGCELFVFPSLYEGFGLPPLEAMACGAPVVCSNTSSLPEVVGDAARLVDPLDIRALADSIRGVMADSILHRHMRKKGLERARAFTWERNAAQTMEVYRKVVSH
jgi:glycosyltransferase involved in cell wall biosynthesis